jgi:putative DNA primase/helicase
MHYTHSLNEITGSFYTAILQTFGHAPAKIDHTGIGKSCPIKRFSSSGKKGDLTGWYQLDVYATPSPFGVFGDWRTGTKQTWRYQGQLTNTQKADLIEGQALRTKRQAADQAEKARKIEQQRTIWDSAAPAEPNHPYLIKKQVGAYGLRQHSNALLIPLRDIAGVIYGIQYIYPDGAKRTHGGLMGFFHHIGKVSKPDETIYLCEGYATGASIFEATGQPVAIAFAAINLTRVGILIRHKYPKANLIIAADNNIRPPDSSLKNTDVEAAREAAKACRAKVIIPNTTTKTDFNDLLTGGSV